jgi:hypothetical protein
MRLMEIIFGWGGESSVGPKTLWRRLWPVAAMVLGLMAVGCSSSTSIVNNDPPSDPAQLYFTPNMGNVYAATYAIDNSASANTFVRTVYGFDGTPAGGGTITDSGVISALSNGVISLGTTYHESSSGVKTTYSPALTGSWAVGWLGQAALIGMDAYPNFTPAVPTQACPSITTKETFQFVTIPEQLSTTGTKIASGSWNPQLETAFGSVAIATTGTTANFSSISQYTFPVNGGAPGQPSNPASASATSVCSSTYYGKTISYPASGTITDPGTSEIVPPSATIGIGPSGFLVEDAGSSQISGDPYENILGAGYGAIGLPMPPSALTTSSLAAAQYQGFLYGTGGPLNTTQTGSGFSLIGSFGYSNLQASCAALPAPSTSTILYGGEFANNDPSSNTFGNCDLAIDLGAQDTKNNGLYPAATVYVTAGFPKNGIGQAYSFPAVAIAGQINGKYAIFLIGVDTSGSPSQAWGIYLLQSS